MTESADNSATNAKSFSSTLKKYAKRYGIDGFSGMAAGLFATLIAGTILKQIGQLCGNNGFGNFLVLIGKVTSLLMGAGIGAGVAKQLKAPNLVIYGSIAAGFIGAFVPEALYASITAGNGVSVAELSAVTSAKVAAFAPGNPIGSYISALLACELGRLVAGKTKFDILVIPMTILAVAGVSVFIDIPAIWLVDLLARFIELATSAQPFIMGIVIAVIMGLALTLPTSSAAIWISIAAGFPDSPSMLLAGGAAVVGCAAHMVGFAVASFRENKWSGLIAQGLGTSMLQIPNVMKKPVILLPAVVASAVVGPLSTCVFKLYCNASGGGMGTSGLVGVIGVIDASSGVIPVWQMVLGIVLLMFVIPAAVSFGVSELMRKKGTLTPDDMKLDL